MTGPAPHPDGPRLPERLRRRLESIHPAPAVPPEVDHAVLRSASAHLHRTRRFRLAWRWGGVAAAAAATLLIAIQLSVRESAQRSPRVAALRSAPAPITILDAYRLARQLEAGQSPDPTLDINADGRIDRADVDALAQAAVRLDGGTR